MFAVSDRIQIPSKTTCKETGTMHRNTCKHCAEKHKKTANRIEITQKFLYHKMLGFVKL